MSGRSSVIISVLIHRPQALCERGQQKTMKTTSSVLCPAVNRIWVWSAITPYTVGDIIRLHWRYVDQTFIENQHLSPTGDL